MVLEVDGSRLAVLMCTPLNLDELALGHLLGRGLLTSREGLASVSVCPDRGSVSVGRLGGKPLPAGGLAVLHSACGAGGDPGALLGLEGRPRLPPGPVFDLDWLSGRARDMFAAAELHRETGGMHCAALATREGFFAVREDVGRHNAVDKVLGRGLLEGLDPAACVLLTSGRIAADMAVKAAFAGIAVLVSRSVPTSSAFAIARDMGICLIGRIGSREPVVYTSPDRVRR